jgi:hemerythrin-like domain-containing protein
VVTNNINNKQDSIQSAIRDTLVRGLTTEHRELLELYQEIQGAVASRRYGAVAKHATMLHDRLHGHMAMENIKLYAELTRQLENADPEKRQLVHGLQREMHSIGRGAIDFIRTAESISLNDNNATQFRAELEALGGVFVRRIRQEEDVLYPLFLSLTQ